MKIAIDTISLLSTLREWEIIPAKLPESLRRLTLPSWKPYMALTGSALKRDRQPPIPLAILTQERTGFPLPHSVWP